MLSVQDLHKSYQVGKTTYEVPVSYTHLVPLNRLLVGFYLVVFTLAAFIPGDFLAIAFDSGGVTTGPMTVPFIMALGLRCV